MRQATRSVWEVTGVSRTLFSGFGLILFFSLFINLLILTSPIYMMQVFDRVLVTGQIETLVYLTIIAGVAILTLGLLDGVRGQILNRVGRFLDQTLREPLLTHTIARSRTRAQNNASMLHDLGSLRGYVGSPAVLPIVDVPWVPLFIAVIFILHPYLGFLATGAAVVLFILALLNDALSRDLLRKAAGLNNVTADHANAAISNADSIHAMGMQKAVAGRYDTSVDQMATASQRAADVSSVVTAISKALRIFVQVAVLALGAYLVTLAELTAGGMIAASIILGRALAPVEQSIGSWRQFRNAQDAFKRIREFLSEFASESERTALPKMTGSVQVEDVTLRFPGADRSVLQRVSFSLEPGSALAVIGPSASGKSSLCKLIVGSWKPSLGSVRIDGAEITMLRPEDVAANIGYLPQNVELFSGTVKENISRLVSADDEAVTDAAKMAGCHDMILALPDSYETELGPQGMYLSGGQRQRIGLARALFGNPTLVVLDEPNSSLDQEGEAALVSAVQQCKLSGTTFVLVSHRFSLLQPVDKVAILRDGKLERFGRRDEVLAELAPRAVAQNRQSQPDTPQSEQAQ